MERKDFLKNGFLGITSILTVSAIPGDNKNKDGATEIDDPDCAVSPRETKGPFPTKTPSQMMQANIKSDRTGIALLINLTILNKNDNCRPMQGALVDVWHCDKDGNYSEYGHHPMQRTDFTAAHFLRGRQVTDKNGLVSFLSVYPGWYRGRAPHIHLEIFSNTGTSLLVTQVAFPENISGKVYASSLYAARGQADTSNSGDNIFADSLSEQVGSVAGNLTDGYTLTKSIVVKA